MVKRIKRRMCRFDTAIGTFLKFFVTLGFVMLLGIGCVSASTLVVSKTSPACTSGDKYYRSIQAAVDSANDGDEIVVCPGTYSEYIVVDKSVNIHSYSGASDTIVGFYDPPNGFNINNDVAFHVKADYVTINGFTIKYRTFGIVLDGVSALDGVNHCNIINNTVSRAQSNFLVI